MNLPMISTDVPDDSDDLSALAWVQDELRRSLEAAHKALRRHLKEAEGLTGSDIDAVDPAVLRSARTQLHQGAGALELIGLPSPARVLRASETAVQRMIAKPTLATPAAVETIERTSFGLLDYLGRTLAGKAVSPIALFPQYRAVQQLAGADRVHPADLWSHAWQWRDLPADADVAPRQIDPDARGEMESLLLRLLRRPDPASTQGMSDFCASLGAGSHGRVSTVWKLAAALFEAQAAGLLRGDVYTKRVAPRLLAQARAGADPVEVSERLAQDLLFFCSSARAPAPGEALPRLRAVREAFALESAPLPDYEAARLGRFDPAWIAQARRRVAGARDVWSAVAGGEMHRLPGLVEQFTLVGESLQKLYPAGDRLAEALVGAATQTTQAGAAPSAALAMEVATGVLYLDASLEDGDLDDPDLAPRVQRLAQRIDSVCLGQEPQPLDAWMEELYRRVSDRQTMGSVVQELRASLSEIEKQIDQYFRDPEQRAVLIPVPAQLSSMRGVFSVLGLDQASQAVVQMRDEIDVLAQTEVDPQRAVAEGLFDRLADNLGALSFLIDMLSVQPQMAKSLFSYDAESGNLRAVMGRADRPSGFGGPGASDRPALADRAQQLAQAAAANEISDDTLAGGLGQLAQQALLAEERNLADAMSNAQAALARAGDDEQRQALRAQLAETMNDIVAPAPVGAPAAPAPRLMPAPGDDAEMREVFIEEAREVIAGATDALGRQAGAAGEGEAVGAIADLTEIRRAFHTLKGSARMVGLGSFGEAAWSCEQLYNSRLAQSAAMDEPLRAFTGDALRYLGDWIEAVAADRAAGFEPASISAAADALRLGLAGVSAPAVAPPPSAAPAAEALAETAADEAFTLDLPGAEEPLTSTLAERVPDLPQAGDLELPQLPPLATETTPAADTALPVADAAEIDFGFDLDVGAAFADTSVVAEPADTGVAATTALATLNFADDVASPAPIELDLGALEAEAVEATGEELVKVIGPLRIDIAMFNIYLNEADELSRRLCIEVAEWAVEAKAPPGENAVVLAHSLAGSSGTVGFTEVSLLARALEHALMRSNDARCVAAIEPELYVEAAEEIRRLLHQFAAGFLKSVAPGLVQRLNEHQPEARPPEESPGRELPEQGPEAAADAVPDLALDVAPEAPEAAEAPAFEAAPTQPGDIAPLPVGTSWAALEPVPAQAVPAAVARADAFDDEDDIDIPDSIDTDLFPIFADEADELLPQLQSRMRDWARRPAESAAAAACMRTLHTFKGGARLAGAMRLGEMAHRLETAIEHLLAREDARPADIEPLVARVDAIESAFETLKSPGLANEPELAPPLLQDAVTSAPDRAAEPAPPAEPVAPATEPAPAIELDFPPEPQPEPAPVAPADSSPAAASPAALPDGAPRVDWSRFRDAASEPEVPADRAAPVSSAAVRVRGPLLDRLVNQAGEVSIARARIEADVGQLKSALGDLTENLERLRRQLRDIELQAESQISSRMEAAKAAAQAFDPLEMDRFTRFQELTRMMAESVNDVATVQRSLQRTLQSTEDELAAQARLTRGLQDDLLRTRMVEFEALADRLYRVVRQAAKETGKQVRLDIVGGATEIDRGVLDRMTGPFEHLLRNSVTHGVEAADERLAAGKDATGAIAISLTQEGNEVGIEFRDDGAGLNLERIRERGLASGLIAAGAQPSESELADLIFTPGFSTATSVTELAGRGVGMDVVRSEVVSMGGRIETASSAGQGTRFRLVLPLTTAVTQVVLLRCGELTVAVPSTLVEVVRRAGADEIEAAYAGGTLRNGDMTLPFFWLAALLDGAPRGAAAAKSQAVVVIRSAAQRVALHVDEVVGNQEVVVKNLGPQLSRLPGLAGMTLLPSGTVAPIYNPVALATLYGDAVRERLRAGHDGGEKPQAAAAPLAPLVLVVDDSLTVRRVTQRLLVREGYRVSTAKDGLDALERLGEEKPAVVLSDIEMPRMDGFDLVRNLRADPKLADLAVIMITSRIAQKHRDYAAELGVDHYLGKPYSEDELLSLVARYAQHATVH
ncbi:MAG TPA: Hpt domain-containing protein [Rubrivivax sp.]